jgi:branched-chain amino acid transport system substrate-binding protein
MGARLAVEDVNAAGGIKSMGGAKLKLVEYDAGDSSEKAKDAAQRMIAQEPDLVGGFGCWLSSFTLAATEVTERAQLPWLTLSYSDLITSRGFKHAATDRRHDDGAARALRPARLCRVPVNECSRRQAAGRQVRRIQHAQRPVAQDRRRRSLGGA